MASSYSPLLRFELINPGEQAGLWGNTTNQNLGTLVEQAIAGSAFITLNSTTDRTLTYLNGAVDEARAAVLNISGTPGGATNIIVPAAQKWWVVRNSCGHTVTMKTSGQVGGVAIPTGASIFIFCDGTNVYPGIQALTLAQGGTGGTDATTARASLGVPSLTGSGASGTWGISITGNADTATTATTADSATTATSVTNGVYTTDLTTGAVRASSGNKVPRFNANGDLAMGTTLSGLYGSTSPTSPSWGMEFGPVGLLYSGSLISNHEMGTYQSTIGLGVNCYYDSSTGAWKLKYAGTNGGMAARMDFNAGVIQFYSAGASTTGGTLNWSFKASINMTTGAYQTASDARLKTDLAPIKDAMAKVRQIAGYTYTHLEAANGRRSAGVIAQEVQKVLPEVVDEGETSLLSVQYGNLSALLIQAIKELDTRISALEARVIGD